MSLPGALGFGNPNQNYIPRGFRAQPAQSTDPIALLQAIASSLQILQEKLAPVPVMTTIQIGAFGQGVAAGAVIANPQLQNPYNAFLVTILQGTVDVSFGGSAGSGVANLQWDMQFNTTLNPLLVPFIIRNDQSLLLWTDPNSAAAAIGKIYILAY